MASLALAFDVLARDKASDTFDKVGRSAEGLGSKLKTSFANIAKIGAAAAGALFVKGFSDALEIGDARAKLAAQLGLSAEDSERIGKVAGNLYSGGWGDSLGQVNEAIRTVGTQLVDLNTVADGELESLTGKVLSVASAFDQDLAGITRTISTMLRNDLAPSAEVALDVLVRGFQTGADKSGDLLDTFNEYAPMFANLGLDAETAMGVLSAGLEAGARDSDKVADAIKELSIRAVDGSKSTGQAFNDLGLDADDLAQRIAAGGPTAKTAFEEIVRAIVSTDDPVKRAQIGVALFGTQFEDVGIDVIAALAPIPGKLGEVEGAAARVDDQLAGTSKTTLTEYKRSLETNLVAVIESSVIPALEHVTEKTKDWGRDGEGVQGTFYNLGGQLADFEGDFLNPFVGAWNAAFGALGSALADLYLDTKAKIEGIQGFFRNLGGSIYDVIAAIGRLSERAKNLSIPGAIIGKIQGREHGGPVHAGVPYIVGEKRPELFIPDVSGYIVPRVPTTDSSERVSAADDPLLAQIIGLREDIRRLPKDYQLAQRSA